MICSTKALDCLVLQTYYMLVFKVIKVDILADESVLKAGRPGAKFVFRHQAFDIGHHSPPFHNIFHDASTAWNTECPISLLISQVFALKSPRYFFSMRHRVVFW